MPICFNRDSSGYDLLKAANISCGRPPVEFRGSTANCLEVGLVNNMPGKALRATERQFITLLDSAAEGIVVRLWLYSLPDVPRTDSGRRHIDSFYDRIDNLWDRPLDGLIVTGTEPRAADLVDEPHWPNMKRLIEWAERNTRSTVWSCLAAHAALLHTDGIVRRRLSEKRFGLFKCKWVSDHQLLSGVPLPMMVPHSRWNDVCEDELTSSGYRVLTRAQHAGADMFVKQRRSLFVFLQGHSEYEANTLLLEYMRDVGRFLRRESDNYPQIPEAYFESDTVAAMKALQSEVLSDQPEKVLADLRTVLSARHLANTWHLPAVRIYGNWLRFLCASKLRRLGVQRSCETPYSVTNSA
jgi:homoserine O-succinyltransferase